MKIPVATEIFSANNTVAEENRLLFKQNHVKVINIMASPGAGKTSLILALYKRLKDRIRFGVIEGDIASTIDAEKIKSLGIQVVQINTGGNCHLDASMVGSSLNNIDLTKIDLLLIENVGNLICPAELDLGAHFSLVMSHVAEGHDKPHKYPGIFKAADVVALNKIELVDAFEFDKVFFEKGVRLVNPDVPIYPLSCKTGKGMNGLIDWIRTKVCDQ
jgi:hydrogenase nickel incorporation protein HypB